MIIKGNILSVLENRIFSGSIKIDNGRIIEIQELAHVSENFIVPGLVDSHVHIESSLLCPTEFARIAVSSGCVSAICDPHEAANVIGIEGVKFMISNAKEVNFKFYFSAPSCVPATPLEVSGGSLDLDDLRSLLKLDVVRSLGEVMDFVGVINGEPKILEKLAVARSFRKVIDGHAPNLSGEALKKYISFGISTDHEVTRPEEAEEKIRNGMKVIIRCGSASEDFDSLFHLIKVYPESLMLGSDDKSPDELKDRYLDFYVRKALRAGIDPFSVFRVSSLNSSVHYGLDVGQLRKGDSADLVIVDNLMDFNIKEVLINGLTVFKDGRCLIESVPIGKINNFSARRVDLDDLKVPAKGGRIRVIRAHENSLFTESLKVDAKVKNGEVVPDTAGDILKVVLVNRYCKEAKPVVGFVNGFGLSHCAFASSVLHDSHHLIGVGDEDTMIMDAINMVVEGRGGMSFVSKDKTMYLPLPILGLMSDRDWFYVAEGYKEMNRFLKEHGSKFSHPFLVLSFLGLPVIPKLKITSFGLFDFESQRIVDLFE